MKLKIVVLLFLGMMSGFAQVKRKLPQLKKQ